MRDRLGTANERKERTKSQIKIDSIRCSNATIWLVAVYKSKTLVQTVEMVTMTKIDR